MEAAYDIDHVYRCVQDNIKARNSAVKQLENEERRAKKETKEAAAAVPIFAVSVGLSTTHYLMIFHSHLHLILFLLRCTNPLIKIDDQY